MVSTGIRIVAAIVLPTIHGATFILEVRAASTRNNWSPSKSDGTIAAEVQE